MTNEDKSGGETTKGCFSRNRSDCDGRVDIYSLDGIDELGMTVPRVPTVLASDATKNDTNGVIFHILDCTYNA